MTGGRARKVRALARELSERTGVLVEASYQGAGAGPWSGWHLWWSGGPATSEMRIIAAGLESVDDDTELLASVWFDRSLSDEHAAAAILGWMADHPDDAEVVLFRDDGGLAGYPDQQRPDIRRRAATLIAAGWRAHCRGAAAEELARRARSGGWPAVRAWLDALGEQQDATVIPMRCRRDGDVADRG